MSEKREHPLRKAETQIAQVASAGDSAEVDLFLDPGSPTDDSPTVISKSHPKPASADEIPTQALRGRTLGHFELLEPIGVGGMAAVLRARDTQLDRIVALKILPPEMAQDAENVKRFHQEARSAAKLDHENIARVFFCGEDQRLHFIAFEYVEGENLRTILEQRGRLPVGESLHYVLQIAAGLAHASRRGVVHRDIKPSNIIITPSGRAKLVDMGLARSLEPQKDLHLTQSGVTLGTFDYISPEQALEPRDADVRSDIYSLGCTLYHMLTGQPPVPEGTAAKKLHHHQHVKPVDPRQLVADIPDHVAVVLARMMAKEPKDRYQSPEHLVHDLLTAARKVNASVPAPEGVLSVEATVPMPASRRPLLVAALAVATVVGVILLLDYSEPSRPSASVGTSADNGTMTPVKDKSGSDSNAPPVSVPAKDVAKSDPAPGPGPEPSEDNQTARYSVDNPTPQNLADWLEKNRDKARLEIELARDLDLKISKQGVDPGLKFKAREVILRSKDPGRPATIRLTYDGPTPEAPWAAATFDCETSRVENIRVLVDANDAAEAAGHKLELIGLWFRNGRSHHLVRCELVQTQPDEGRRLASVVVEASPALASPCKFDVEECCFRGYRTLSKEEKNGMGAGATLLKLSRLEGGGQNAIVRRGPVNIEAVNCAFSPHATAFRLERSTAIPPGLTLKHCTVALAGRAAVVHLADNASAHMEARHCLFARVGDASLGDMASDAGAVLIRQTDLREREPNVSFAGLDNRYHNLDAYWPAAEARAADWAGFRGRFEHASSLELKESPWNLERPLEALENYRLMVQTDAGRPLQDDAALRREEENHLRDAFQVKLRVRDLRQGDLPENALKRLVGVEQVLGFSYIAKLPALVDAKPEPVARKGRIVNPDLAQEDPTNGIHQSLEQAILAAKPGETIFIRKNGPIAIDQPISLKKAMVDLTLKADKDFKPILTLGETRDRSAALFALYDGKLRLEDLEFRLRPANAEYESQAVVALVGGGQCSLKNCTITLDRASKETALSVATLSEPAMAMMKMDTQAPLLELENCLVRGDGDLARSRTGKPFDIRLRNTLLALNGSLLLAEADGGGATAGSQRSVLSLSRVTSYLAGPLIRLQAGKDFKALASLTCKPNECVFVAATGKALVLLDGNDVGARALKDKLSWEPGNNVYANFTDMVSFQPRGEEMTAPALNQQQWKEFSGEMSGRFQTVKFAGPVPTESNYLGVTPSPFKVLDPANYGADVNGSSPAPEIK